MKKHWKRKYLLFAFAGLAVVAASVIVLHFWKKDVSDPVETGYADGETALLALKSYAGESRVETLANLKEMKGGQEPEAYLVQNSVYILDEAAIEKAVQENVNGAESTANTLRMTNQELIVDTWGYESVDAYVEEVRNSLISFIKERLCVYELAKKEHVTITEKEYEEQLSFYASIYGYDEPAVFAFECLPSSIANEMLYDKMVNQL